MGSEPRRPERPVLYTGAGELKPEHGHEPLPRVHVTVDIRKSGGEILTSTYRYSSHNGAQPATNTPCQPSDGKSREEVTRLLERERVLNEVLQGPLPPGLDLPTEAQVLHIACGPGTWLHLLSLNYPSLRMTGMEKSPYYVQCARHYLAGLETVTLQVRDIGNECAFLPTCTFDLVHLRFLAAELPHDVLQEAVAELVTSCKRGAHVYWTESTFPLTTGAACEQLVSSIRQGLKRQHRGSVLCSTFPSLRAYMASMLQRTGCSIVQDKQQVLDVSAGTPAYHAFVQQACVVIQQLRPLVVQAGVLAYDVYDALAAQALGEMCGPYFYGALFLHSMLAVTP